MAHFEPPHDGLLGEYDVDGKLAMGSVWRMSVGLDAEGADVALYGGAGLSIRSNDPSVVANPLPERAGGGLRIFRLRGMKVGVTMLEAGMPSSTPNGWAPGSPWVSLQVQVKSTLKAARNGDGLVTLSPPHMAINSFDTPMAYQMKYNREIGPGTPVQNVLQQIGSVGRLRHLVVSCHGEIVFDPVTHAMKDSVVHVSGQNHPGLNRANIELLAQLKAIIQGGVIWFGACAIGNDVEYNYARAQATGAYIVAPIMYMQPKGKVKGRQKCSSSKIDMYDRFIPRVFAPDRTPVSYPALLAMSQLGIRG